MSGSDIKHKQTDVGYDTGVRVKDLSLEHGKKYQVFVAATDEMDNCEIATGVFTVDATPPNEGTVGVGKDLNDKVSVNLF